MTSPVKVKFKRTHQDTEIPCLGTKGAAAFDLVAVGATVNYAKGYIEYKTGLCVAIPKGYAGFVFPRSSISKTVHSLANSVGVIDSDYRGEILIRMRFNEYNSVDASDDIYAVGDRIAQLIIMEVPSVEFEEDELGFTERGSGGFGSTGR